MADNGSNTEPDEFDKEKGDKENEGQQVNKEEQQPDDPDNWSSSVPSPQPSEAQSEPHEPPASPPHSPPLDVSPDSKLGNDDVSVEESVENKEKKKETELATRESVTVKTVEKVGVAVCSLQNCIYFNTEIQGKGKQRQKEKIKLPVRSDWSLADTRDYRHGYPVSLLSM